MKRLSRPRLGSTQRCLRSVFLSITPEIGHGQCTGKLGEKLRYVIRGGHFEHFNL